MSADEDLIDVFDELRLLHVQEAALDVAEKDPAFAKRLDKLLARYTVDDRSPAEPEPVLQRRLKLVVNKLLKP